STPSSPASMATLRPTALRRDVSPSARPSSPPLSPATPTGAPASPAASTATAWSRRRRRRSPTVPEASTLQTEWIAAALADAVGIAGDPTLIAAQADGLMTVRWGNRAFVDTIRSEIADLAGLTLP